MENVEMFENQPISIFSGLLAIRYQHIAVID